MQLLQQQDIVGRTSELARVFGIQFYHVLTRGSQVPANHSPPCWDQPITAHRALGPGRRGSGLSCRTDRPQCEVHLMYNIQEQIADVGGWETGHPVCV